MELDNLKEIWAEQGKKLDRNWKLNLEILKKVNISKAKSKMKSLTWITSFTLIFYGLMALYFIRFTISNIETLQFSLSGGILSIWTLAISIGFMNQLELIRKINYSEPVVKLQKKLETLKVLIIKHLRLGVIILPFYMTFVILMFKIVLGMDIISIASKNWLITQAAVSVAFIPVSIWLYRKLSPQNFKESWLKVLLKGTGSNVAEAMNFIEEIEAFENQ